jgi:hypothetical protein
LFTICSIEAETRRLSPPLLGVLEPVRWLPFSAARPDPFSVSFLDFSWGRLASRAASPDTFDVPLAFFDGFEVPRPPEKYDRMKN